MKKKLSFKNMDHSDPIEKHVNNKLERLEELLKKDQQPPFHMDIHLEAHKVHGHHHVELHLKTPRMDLHSHDEGPDMYVAIDNAIDKMVNLVRKNKAKNKNKEHKPENDKTNFSDDKYNL